jgi:hypothetical protein
MGMLSEMCQMQVNRGEKIVCVLAVLASLASPFVATAGPPADLTTRQELIKGIKHLEKNLGFRRTRNFSSTSDKSMAAYRCYYTGKLELPDSYDGLQLRQGGKGGCPVDPEKYDIFFYPVEAVASGRIPVTAALEHDSVERFLVVIPHEDFHENRELRKLPATLTEAASTLMGFLMAGEVARVKLGADSGAYRNLAKESELFLEKAAIVNRYHKMLGQLYDDSRSGKVATKEALIRKEKLFQAMRAECDAIQPDPYSFNKCLAASNNAGLAFDATYTRYYPLIYNLYVVHSRDMATTAALLKRALNTGSESEAVRRLQDLGAVTKSRALPLHRAGN